jgi:hypothetical protein
MFPAEIAGTRLESWKIRVCWEFVEVVAIPKKPFLPKPLTSLADGSSPSTTKNQIQKRAEFVGHVFSTTLKPPTA